MMAMRFVSLSLLACVLLIGVPFAGGLGQVGITGGWGQTS